MAEMCGYFIDPQPDLAHGCFEQHARGSRRQPCADQITHSQYQFYLATIFKAGPSLSGQRCTAYFVTGHTNRTSWHDVAEKGQSVPAECTTAHHESGEPADLGQLSASAIGSSVSGPYDHWQRREHALAACGWQR